MFVPVFLQPQLSDVFDGACGEVHLNPKGPSATQTPAFPQTATQTHSSFPCHYLCMLHPLSSWLFFPDMLDRHKAHGKVC